MTHSKIYKLFAGICILGLLISATPPQEAVFNQSTWHIRIGKRTLKSSTINTMGDTIALARKKMKPQDSLFAGIFFCGYNGTDATLKLTIKTERGDVIGQTTQQQGNSMIYGASIPIKDILSSSLFQNTKMLSVFLAIDQSTHQIKNEYLLCKLLLL